MIKLDNKFTSDFKDHLKFSYSFFDRIIVRGYIIGMFRPANVIVLLRNLGFAKHTNGVFKLLSDQLNNHIKKLATKLEVPILWRENHGGKEAISKIDATLLGDNENEFTTAVHTNKGKRVAAPDLRNPKQLAILAVLSNPRFTTEWFRTKDLMRYLSGYFAKTAEIRYQMEKPRVRGLIEKRQSANYYRVTEKGYSWLNVAYSYNRYFLTPLLSSNLQIELYSKNKGLDKFEQAQKQIKAGLNAIYQELNISA